MILLQGIRERIDVLRFSPDGRLLVAGPVGLQVWRDPTVGGRPATVLGQRYVRWVGFTPDGLKLLLDMLPTRVVVHDLASGQGTEVTLDGGEFCELTPDGRFLVVGQTDTWMEPTPGRLSCRPLDDLARSAWSVETPGRICSRPVFLAGGERFVVFEGRQDSIPFWHVTRDTRTGQVLAEAVGSGQQFHGPVASPDGRLVAARRGVWLGVFRADDFGAGPVVLRNDGRKEFTALAFHPSGRYLAATSNDASVKLFDTATWKVAAAFDWDIGRLRSVAFSPDGMLAAAAGDKGRIVVWDFDL